MVRLLLVIGLFALVLVGCEKAGPSKLEVYIAEKEARPGLHAANFQDSPISITSRKNLISRSRNWKR
jgi:hypothetical protein